VVSVVKVSLFDKIKTLANSQVSTHKNLTVVLLEFVLIYIDFTGVWN